MSRARQVEQDALDLYEQAGYEVYQPPKAKYREQDVFGLFDLLAFGHGRLVCVQVKAQDRNRGITEWFDRARPYEEHLTDVTVEWLLWGPEGIRLYRTDSEGYQVAYDGREIEETPGDIVEEVLRP